MRRRGSTSVQFLIFFFSLSLAFFFSPAPSSSLPTSAADSINPPFPSSTFPLSLFPSPKLLLGDVCSLIKTALLACVHAPGQISSLFFSFFFLSRQKDRRTLLCDDVHEPSQAPLFTFISFLLPSFCCSFVCLILTVLLILSCSSTYCS